MAWRDMYQVKNEYSASGKTLPHVWFWIPVLPPLAHETGEMERRWKLGLSATVGICNVGST